ncbi:disulfide bond formation protein B [Sphingomonas lacunae]|nr:disulfide bond formation protein B [Sphingomonas lacunae]
MTASSLRPAALLAFLIPAIALTGALTSQYVFGLYPCEMCHWQRWPHYAALVPALAAILLPLQPGAKRGLILIAALLIAASGAIGAYHAGVEYGFWPGFSTCTAGVGTSLEAIWNAPVIRCDVPAFTLFGISMAGYNAIASLGGAALVAVLLKRASSQG